MQVIKLGGSLMSDPLVLRAMLRRLGQFSGIIVPGGGRFADQVRFEQQQWAFDDGVAHDMAIMAMHQFGRLLLALHPQLVGGHTIDALDQQSRTAMTVWLPDYRELQNTELAANWGITSDSIALWLAQRLSACKLVLVKSAPVDPEISLEQMQQGGLIDAGFKTLAATGKVQIQVISKNGFDEYFSF